MEYVGPADESVWHSHEDDRKTSGRHRLRFASPLPKLMHRLLCAIGVGVITASVPSCATISHIPGPPATEVSTGTDSADAVLRVMTYNIRFDWNRDTGRREWRVRQPLVEHIILNSGAHVIGLQEVLSAEDLVYLPSSQLAWASALSGYCIVHREVRFLSPTRDHYEAIIYQPILYECEALTLNRSGSFALSETPEVYNSISWGNRIPRFVTWAELETLDGRRFVVFNTHIDTRYGRAESLELIRRTLDQIDVPVILVGDFNMTGMNPRIRRLGLVDASSGRRGRTFNSFSPFGLWRIDHVLVSSQIEVHGSGVVRFRESGIVPSDHFPVYADLIVPPVTQ